MSGSHSSDHRVTTSLKNPRLKPFRGSIERLSSPSLALAAIQRPKVHVTLSVTPPDL